MGGCLADRFADFTDIHARYVHVCVCLCGMQAPTVSMIFKQHEAKKEEPASMMHSLRQAFVRLSPW